MGIIFNNVYGYSFPAVAATIQDTVERVGVRRIILAVLPLSEEGQSSSFVSMGWEALSK